MSPKEATKEIHIIGGGTVFHIRPHLALSAPAYGKTAKILRNLILSKDSNRKIQLHLTRMAGGDSLETNDDISKLIDNLLDDPAPKILFMSAALCDFEGNVLAGNEYNVGVTESGKEQPRLKTSNGLHMLSMKPADKIIGRIRKTRKDIFLVGFKTTAGATEEEQFEAGMKLLKQNSCNLVLANDVHTRMNMILTPEMAAYGKTTDRFEALNELIDITLARSTNEFTRTRVVADVPIAWHTAPSTLKTVVEHCVKRGAYQAFDGKTVGHFGFLVNEKCIFSSRRKQNYNEPGGLDLAMVSFSDNEIVESIGGKPSAGVRSQFELLRQYDQFDCVVHFHCEMKTKNVIPKVSQKFFECGSHQCGQNTASGIKLFESDKIGAVMLDKHGPNVLFRSTADPEMVINFIETHFDLTKRTG